MLVKESGNLLKEEIINNIWQCSQQRQPSDYSSVKMYDVYLSQHVKVSIIKTKGFISKKACKLLKV